MRRQVLMFALGLAIGSVAHVLAQPGDPNNPYGSTAGEFQRGPEYEAGGDHVGVSLRGLVTTPTPARPDRCYFYCDGSADQLKLSVDGGAFAAIGGSGTGAGCISCATPGTVVINGETTDIRRIKPKDATGTNQSNAQTIVQGGCGTGSGTGGDVALAVCPASTPGATPNTPHSVWGVIANSGHLLPLVPSTYDIGSDPLFVRAIYVGEVHTGTIIDGVGQWDFASGNLLPVQATQNIGEALTPVQTLFVSHVTAAEISASGVTGSGKVICVKANGDFGVCSDAPGGSGTCTCG